MIERSEDHERYFHGSQSKKVPKSTIPEKQDSSFQNHMKIGMNVYFEHRNSAAKSRTIETFFCLQRTFLKFYKHGTIYPKIGRNWHKEVGKKFQTNIFDEDMSSRLTSAIFYYGLPQWRSATTFFQLSRCLLLIFLPSRRKTPPMVYFIYSYKTRKIVVWKVQFWTTRVS